MKNLEEQVREYIIECTNNNEGEIGDILQRELVWFDSVSNNVLILTGLTINHEEREEHEKTFEKLSNEVFKKFTDIENVVVVDNFMFSRKK